MGGSETVRRGSSILGALAQHFARALQSGQRFGELRADVDDLEHGRDQEGQQRGEGHEVAESS